jgi:hypothetical protein
VSGPRADLRTPVKPGGKHPDGSTRYVLDHTPQPARISKHRGGRTYPWNDKTQARVGQYVRKLIQARKTAVINEKAGLG